MKVETLKEELKNMKEPRRESYGNIRHKLEDIIIIGLCTVICGGEDFTDMEDFCEEREDFLRNFLELPHGIPDSDTFRRVFEKLDPAELSRCLNNWIAAEREKRAVIAIDGKTICGSGNSKHGAYHVVSAFVAENEIPLGEIAVNEKSNEITAVPELLDLIDAEGAIVTADAMSRQKKIVSKIADKKADYVIAVKENQPTLLHDMHKWWPDEQPSQAIKEYVEQQLVENKIDIVFSHTCPAKYIPTECFLSCIDQSKVDNSTEQWLDTIEDDLEYEAWYLGHWHTDKRIDKMHFLFHGVEIL